MEQIAVVILKYKIVIFVVISLLTGFFGYYASQSETDNSIEVWLKDGDPGLKYYYEFIEKYGDEEFLIIAINDKNIFSAEKLKLISKIANGLSKLDDVKNVISLASVLKDKLSSPYFKKTLKENRGKKVLDIFREEILSDYMYVNNVISDDGETTAIIATVAKGQPESRIKLVEGAIKIIKAFGQGGESNMALPNTPLLNGGANEETVERGQALKDEIKGPGGLPKGFYLAGPSVVNAELDRMSQKDIMTFTPVMFGVAFIVLIVLFRNISGVVIPILTISINTIWASGLFVIFQNKMNMVSGMLIPIIFIISLATTIHILNRFYQESMLSQDRKRNTIETIKHIGIPCFLTCATTSVGFLSLMVSDVPPVKTTGIFLAAGVMMSFFVCMTLVPCILSVFARSGRSTDKKLTNTEIGETINFHGLFGIIGKFVNNNTKWIFTASIILVGFAIYGTTKIRVESNIFEAFPKESVIAESTTYIEDNLMGLLPVEIAVNAVNSGGIFHPATLDSLGEMQNYLNNIPEVTASTSINDYINKLNNLVNRNNANKPEMTIEKARDYVKLASLHGDNIVKTLYTNDGNEGRISVRMKNVGSSRYREIIRDINGFIKDNVPLNITCTITGIVPLLIDMQRYLVQSQIKSFSLAFILVFLCITIFLKSLRIGMMSMIPNLIPVVITLGVMGYLNIYLDVATIMIASVAIGISVDDTIHFLYRFKHEFQVDGNYYLAIQRSLSGVGRALFFTTVVATCGFLMFCLSSFKPIQYFGLLTGITMISALVADIFILPSCILLFKPRFK